MFARTPPPPFDVASVVVRVATAAPATPRTARTLSEALSAPVAAIRVTGQPTGILPPPEPFRH
jgi:hypothetical protein